MKAGDQKRAFVARPSNPDTWVRTPEQRLNDSAKTALFTARLTIDVTPELRGRIKVAAFQRGVTVADMLRDLLTREFPHNSGDAA